MHAFIRLIVPCLIGTAVATFAQSPAKQDPADAAWLNVTTLATPIASTKSTATVAAGDNAGVNGSTDASISHLISTPANLNDKAVLPAESKSSLQLQIERFQQASQSANAFYTTYPKHAQAAAAKKIEAFTALQSVQLGDASYAAKALQIGQTYRADQNNPAKDRFDIAVTMEMGAWKDTGKGKRWMDDSVAYEKLADALHDEFGDIPEVYNFYLGVTRTVDPATAVRVARRLAQMQPTPDSVRNAAQKIVDRNDLIGQKIDLPLTMAGGQTSNLKSLTGRPTVVFVWNAQSGTGDMEAFARFRALVPATDVCWVYIALGSVAPQTAPPAWKAATEIRCYEKPGFNNPTADRLKLQQTPYLYVLDAKAQLTGFGRVEDLPALLEAANR